LRLYNGEKDLESNSNGLMPVIPCTLLNKCPLGMW
jgi:hypothetical protein